ncbi:MAG TPA: hypothetical protein VNE16_11420 [Vicinamibacterales bacterium]|nr:hypothetical protein [Vicinamibacterales bacterium]
MLLVALFIEMGLLLIAVPWTVFWERNYFTEAVPWLQVLLTNNFVRGAVTGLGLINLYVGLVDLAYLVGGTVRPPRGGAPGPGAGRGRPAAGPRDDASVETEPADLPIED